MVTDAQVRLMRQKRMDGKTQAAAAAASDMSLRSAREWDTGPAPSASKQPRDWRGLGGFVFTRSGRERSFLQPGRPVEDDCDGRLRGLLRQRVYEEALAVGRHIVRII